MDFDSSVTGGSNYLLEDPSLTLLTHDGATASIWSASSPFLASDLQSHSGALVPAQTAAVTAVPSSSSSSAEFPLLPAPADRFTLEESLLIQGLHAFTADCVARIYLAMAQYRIDFLEDMCKCLTEGGTYK